MDIIAESAVPVITAPCSVAEDLRPLRYACSTTWEHSMSDDSDWWLVCYEPETDTLARVLDGTTRYASSLYGRSGALTMTDDMRPRALAALVRLYLDKVVHRERVQVFEPGPKDLAVGTRVRFLADHRCMAKVQDHAACPRCGGSGTWQNPKVEGDARPCFACRGDGVIIIRQKVSRKDADWHQVVARSTGVVLWQKSFGRFYRNGHNEPDRENTTVYVMLDDGRLVQAPLDKLRLDREMATDEVLLGMAEDLADGGSDDAFYRPFATASVSHF